MNQSWRYYKAYPGPTIGGVEQLVAETIPELLSEALQVDRWFFLRYTDEGGGHLRLRMRVAPEAAPKIERLLADGVQRLANAAIPLYRPVLDPSAFGAWSTDTRPPRVETATYEPEIEKFGSLGIGIAEELFERSSEIALRVIRGERSRGCPRKTLVPILMQDVLAIFAPQERSTFWPFYARSWLANRKDHIDQWLPRFRAKYADLVSLSIPIITADTSLPEDGREVVRTWRAALVKAASAYAELRAAPRPTELAFHFTHLMNNRLGLFPGGGGILRHAHRVRAGRAGVTAPARTTLNSRDLCQKYPFAKLVQPRVGLIDSVAFLPQDIESPEFEVAATALGNLTMTFSNVRRGNGTDVRDELLGGAGGDIDPEIAWVRSVAEAAERYSSMVLSDDDCLVASAEELGTRAIDLSTLARCSATELTDPKCPLRVADTSARMRWVRGISLLTQKETLVPAILTHLHFQPWPSERFWLPISTGVAAPYHESPHYGPTIRYLRSDRA